MAEQIEMPFGVCTQMESRKHVLDGGQDPLWEGALLMGTTYPGMPVVNIRRYLQGGSFAMLPHATSMGNKSVPIQLAQCWFILLNKTYGSIFIKQSETGMV